MNKNFGIEPRFSKTWKSPHTYSWVMGFQLFRKPNSQISAHMFKTLTFLTRKHDCAENDFRSFGNCSRNQVFQLGNTISQKSDVSFSLNLRTKKLNWTQLNSIQPN